MQPKQEQGSPLISFYPITLIATEILTVVPQDLMYAHKLHLHASAHFILPPGYILWNSGWGNARCAAPVSTSRGKSNLDGCQRSMRKSSSLHFLLAFQPPSICSLTFLTNAFPSFWTLKEIAHRHNLDIHIKKWWQQSDADYWSVSFSRWLVTAVCDNALICTLCVH